MKDYSSVLNTLSKNASSCTELLKILDEELSLPTIKFPTLGGNVFWITLAESNGWKIQQNTITKHARILNDKNVRIAWGTINGMEKALDRMLRFSQKYTDQT